MLTEDYRYGWLKYSFGCDVKTLVLLSKMLVARGAERSIVLLRSTCSISNSGLMFCCWNC
jgi:hypothetical protein